MKKDNYPLNIYSDQSMLSFYNKMPIIPISSYVPTHVYPNKRESTQQDSTFYLPKDKNDPMKIHPLNNAKTEWLLTLDDDIDMETYRRLEQETVDTVCQTLFEAKAKKLTVDLTTTKRISSLGLQLLLLMYKKCTGREIKIALLNPSGQLERILQILQFDRIFTIEYG